MRIPTSVVAVATSFVLLACVGARAEEVDPATLYDISTDGSSAKVKPGEKGKVVLTIKTKNGSHVSEEAPTSIKLSSEKVKLEKSDLKQADSVAKKAAGQAWVDPRFEVGFTGAAPGKTSVDAKMTFFICTEHLCARQQKTVNIPVEIAGT